MKNEYKDLAMKYQHMTDKLSLQGDYSNGHTYPVIYDHLFYGYKDKKINFLEIGLSSGGNIALCSEYFTDVDHYGIDISDYIQIDRSLFTFYHGSFNDPNIVKLASERQYDIILEDASHQLDHQVESIKLYLPMLKADGIMIIEDIQDVNYLPAIYDVIDTQKYFAYTVDLRFNKNRWDDLIVVIEHRDKKYK
jgi:hypothetical protein